MALSGTKGSGKNVSISIGGTVIEQGVLLSVRRSSSQDMVEVTGAGGGSKEFVEGENTDTYTVELLATDDYADVQDNFPKNNGSALAFIHYPDGNSSGNVKETSSVLVTSVETSTPKNDSKTVTVQLQCTGAVTEATIS